MRLEVAVYVVPLLIYDLAIQRDQVLVDLAINAVARKSCIQLEPSRRGQRIKRIAGGLVDEDAVDPLLNRPRVWRVTGADRRATGQIRDVPGDQGPVYAVLRVVIDRLRTDVL